MDRCDAACAEGEAAKLIAAALQNAQMQQRPSRQLDIRRTPHHVTLSDAQVQRN